MILSKYNKLNITFCGMMGSGKSIIGSKFAKIIKFDFIDTDALIEEKTGKSINEIFDKFRRPTIWTKENNNWKLRQQVTKL